MAKSEGEGCGCPSTGRRPGFTACGCSRPACPCLRGMTCFSGACDSSAELTFAVTPKVPALPGQAAVAVLLLLVDSRVLGSVCLRLLMTHLQPLQVSRA